MSQPFIVFLRDKETVEFKYTKGITRVSCIKGRYRITFSNHKTYNYNSERVRYYPLLSTRENVRIYERGKLNPQYNSVDNYGMYLIFRNHKDSTHPILNSKNIEICDIKKVSSETFSIMRYFTSILTKIGGVSFDIETGTTEDKTVEQVCNDLLLKSLNNIDLQESRSAFSDYIEGVTRNPEKPKSPLIYPFGCNESQKLAVETALTNSISVIEGPPGTGKTQTILNLIANLITQNKSVAVVSNNNSAVFNVREKLQKNGYGQIIASLGNKENKDEFFKEINRQCFSKELVLSTKRLSQAKDKATKLNQLLTKGFQYRNEIAKLKELLSDMQTEFEHLKAEQPLHPEMKTQIDAKFHRKISYSKILKLKDLRHKVSIRKRLSVFDHMKALFSYGILYLPHLLEQGEDFENYVNHKFYELYIAKIQTKIHKKEKWLKQNDENSNLAQFVDLSKKIFNTELYNKYCELSTITDFKTDNYLKRFDEFIERYPLLLSTTLSLSSSIPSNHLLDYVIIDEASQVDIIKAAVCFSCCRNVVVVGDSMQLTHIVDQQSQEIADELNEFYHTPPAYDYVKQNILESLKLLYGEHLKSVLLKEHYRCHPKIIAFCNKKYYNNALITMTHSENKYPFKIINTTTKGGKGNFNKRQIEETAEYIKSLSPHSYEKIGVIAPYRSHANMLQKQLPENIEADTIHKFQGREKEIIILNTVRSEIVDFIDNPNLINVAVSRAIKEFVVVKPELMDLPHGTNIGDLIRYICYISDPKEIIIRGKLCSVFDILYKEYNNAYSLLHTSNNTLNGSPAEIIIHRLLKEKILVENHRFAAIDMAREYKLRDLIREYNLFSEEERLFIQNNSRLDFLLYSKIDKTPILAIEVDGVSFHKKEVQQRRDQKKDHILQKLGLSLLRLSTDGNNEEAKIIDALDRAMSIPPIN